MWGIFQIESKHEKSITVKIYKWGCKPMQEHLVVTLDGTDYLVEPGTNLLEFIRSRDTFVPCDLL